MFSKTYFALEEAGWGYPCLPLANNCSREQLAVYDAMLRVLADAYRVAPSQYTTTETRWHVAEDVKPKIGCAVLAMSFVTTPEPRHYR